MKEISDLELINKVIAGEKWAFGEIVKKYKSKVAATVINMLGNTQEAEDVGQEVFIRFYKSIENFRGEAQLGTYLVRIAINLSLNEIKKRKRQRLLSFESWSKSAAETMEEENKTNKLEQSEIIRRAMNKLNPKHRSVIVLRLVDGYSTEETAKILNLPVGTVLSRLSRGQQKLKELLAPLIEEL